jgi:hypothetical protein
VSERLTSNYAWYSTGPFAPYVREHRLAGSVGDIFEVAQPPGDFSDPPTSDLLLIRAVSDGISQRSDLGGGRFEKRSRAGDLFLVAPETATDILVHDDHVIRCFAFPAATLRPHLEEARPGRDPFDFGRLHAGPFRNPLVLGLLDRLRDEAARGDGESRLFAEGAVLAIAAELLRESGHAPRLTTGRGADRLELSSPADPTTHLLAVATLGHHATYLVGGREVHEGRFEAGAVQLVQAGEAAAAVLTGDWRAIQFYLPVKDLRQLAEDLGLATVDAQALAFAMPCFAREPVLGRIGQRLDRRLGRGDAPSRLELDELVLTIGCRLIRAHATVKPLRRTPPPALSAAERRRLSALLGDADDPGLAELAQALDRSPAEAERAFIEAFRAAPHQIRASLMKRRLS